MKFKDLLEHSDIEHDDKAHERVEADEWKYAVTQTGSSLTEGNEIKMHTEEHVYAGEFVRNMIESRRYRPKSYTWLGYTENPKRGIQEVGIPHESLFKHTAVFGNSGYGKSTVMKNMMLQWIQGGYGLCFVDPKGDDSPKMLRTIPEHRKDDIIWVEPGATDKRDTVGFNVLDTLAEPGTTEQESEADAVVEDLIGLFESICQRWSPKMAGIVNAILSQMIRAKEDYTLIDLYKVLESQAERDAFLDMYGENMDSMDREYVENLDPQEVSDLTQTIKQLISKPLTRNIIASPNSNASIADAIEDDKILLCNFSNIGDDNLEQVTAFFVRRIWSTIKARKDTPEHERDPFFMCLDEFDNLTKDFEDRDDMMRIDEILSTARSFRMSCLLANQNPTQLAEDIKQHVYGNCNNLFTFNQGNYNDAGDLSQGIKDLDARQIMGLSEFRLLGRLTIDGDKTPGLLIHTFPEYPPLRTEEECMNLLDKSTAKYGSGSQSGGFDESNFGVLRYQEEGDDDQTLSKENETISLRTVLTLLKSAEENEHINSSDGVTFNLFKELFQPHSDEFTVSDVESKLISPNIGSVFNAEKQGDGGVVSLTQAGQEELTDELDSACLEKSLSKLSSLGLGVASPVREREAVHYDFVGYPPIRPTEESHIMETAIELDEILESSYPELYEHFQDRAVVVSEVEEPLSEVQTIIKSISSADDTQHPVFAVPDESAVQQIKTLLLDNNGTPPLYKDATGDENVLYTTEQAVGVESGVRPLHTADDSDWVEVDGRLLLRTDDGDVIVEFDSHRELKYNASPEHFPYYARQSDDGLEIVSGSRDDDEIVGEYQTISDAEEDGFTTVKQPIVPDAELPAGSINSDWSVLVADDEPSLVDI